MHFWQMPDGYKNADLPLDLFDRVAALRVVEMIEDGELVGVLERIAPEWPDEVIRKWFAFTALLECARSEHEAPEA